MNTTLRCLKSGSGAQAVYTHVTWRLFYADCPKINQLCNKKSNAFVPAITVCNQKLFT